MRIAGNKFLKIALILGAALLVYCAGYALCRKRQIIVHRSSCAAAQYTSHEVSDGDAKIASLNPQLAAFYTPLRYLELFYWHQVRPIGSSCP